MSEIDVAGLEMAYLKTRIANAADRLDETASHDCPPGTIDWSEMHGQSPRRIYWHCLSCGRCGALLFPRAQYVRYGELGALEVASEEFLRHRNYWRDVDLVEFAASAVRDAVKWVKKKLDDELQARRYNLWSHLAAVSSSRSGFMRRERRSGDIGVLPEFNALSTEDTGPTIYGLVDPAEPSRVRYVGMTAVPVNRYSAHLREFNSVKQAWWSYLHSQNRVPVMVILEQNPGDPLADAEKRWIKTLVARGEADLNVTHAKEAVSHVAA